MADPHIKSPMDYWDRLSVRLYRSGFALATVGFVLMLWQPDVARLALLVAAAMTASSLHIYLKSVRTLLQYSAWIGLLLAIFGLPVWGLGFALVTLSGLAFKEHFCFKVLGLNFQPVFGALLWLSIYFDWMLGVYSFAIISAVLFDILTVKKTQMPLHFDIGDKNQYEN